MCPAVSNCKNGIYIFTDTSPSRFRLVGSHFTKASGTWSLKSPATTEFTRLPHRYTLIGTLSMFSVPQPRCPYLRRLDSESNSSPRSRGTSNCTRCITVLAAIGGGKFKQKAMRDIRLIRRRMIHGDGRLFGMQKQVSRTARSLTPRSFLLLSPQSFGGDLIHLSFSHYL